jgi:amidophosphoribosyltransferase
MCGATPTVGQQAWSNGKWPTVGIDMSGREELIAAYKTIPGVEAVINPDSLGDTCNEGLVKTIGLPKENLCMGCLTGVYPL